MKKIIGFILVITLMFSILPATLATEKDITVSVFGKNIDFVDAKPYIDAQSSRTLVPMRIIFEALNAVVDWQPETRTVVATTENRIVTLVIDSDEATVNGEKITLDQNAVIKDDRTMVPLRFVAESLNLTVDWSAENRHITISAKAEPTSAPLKINSGSSSGGGSSSRRNNSPSKKDDATETTAPDTEKDITLPETVSWISMEDYDYIPNFGEMFNIEVDESRSILKGTSKVYAYHVGNVTNNPSTIKMLSIKFDLAVQANGYGHLQNVGSRQHIYTNDDKSFSFEITNMTSNCDECYVFISFTE